MKPCSTLSQMLLIPIVIDANFLYPASVQALLREAVRVFITSFRKAPSLDFPSAIALLQHRKKCCINDLSARAWSP